MLVSKSFISESDSRAKLNLAQVGGTSVDRSDAPNFFENIVSHYTCSRASSSSQACRVGSSCFIVGDGSKKHSSVAHHFRLCQAGLAHEPDNPAIEVVFHHVA